MSVAEMIPPLVPVPSQRGVPLPTLLVPRDIGEQLVAGQTAGITAAQEWQSANPGGTPDAFVAHVSKQIGAPPTGAAAAADLARVHQAVATRTKDSARATTYYSESGHRAVWGNLLGEWQKRVPPDQARRGAELLRHVDTMVGTATNRAKDLHTRPRPFKVDPSLKPLNGFVGIGKTGSFPSGHAALAYAEAAVLAELMPNRRAEFEGIAARVAYSRVHDALHFPTDVVTGAQLGSALAAFAISQAATVADAAAGASLAA